MSNNSRHKDQLINNPILKPDPFPNPNRNPNPTYPNKPTEPYKTVLTLTDTVGLRCLPSNRHTSQWFTCYVQELRPCLTGLRSADVLWLYTGYGRRRTAGRGAPKNACLETHTSTYRLTLDDSRSLHSSKHRDDSATDRFSLALTL